MKWNDIHGPDPVMDDLARHLAEVDAREREEAWLAQIERELVAEAERGAVEWLEWGENCLFGEEVHAILADRHAHKVSRILQARSRRIEAWAQATAPLVLASRQAEIESERAYANRKGD